MLDRRSSTRHRIGLRPGRLACRSPRRRGSHFAHPTRPKKAVRAREARLPTSGGASSAVSNLRDGRGTIGWRRATHRVATSGFSGGLSRLSDTMDWRELVPVEEAPPRRAEDVIDDREFVPDAGTPPTGQDQERSVSVALDRRTGKPLTLDFQNEPKWTFIHGT
jgi:hypothetical protein